MSGENPTVSVCLPAYNEEEFIAETIESVLEQTISDFELIVVDDGSTDKTAEIIHSYSEQDERLEYIYQENAGVAVAQNTAIEHSTGTYCAILESDDLWEPEKLERQTDYMRRTNAMMTHTNASEIDEVGSVTGIHHRSEPPIQNDRETYLKQLFLRNFICTPTVMIDRNVIEDRPFDETFDQSHDHDLWLRIAAEHDVGYLDEKLGKKRYHGSNLSGDYENAFQMRKKFVTKAVERYPELSSVREQKLASIYLTLGINRILAGETSEGRKALVRSLSHNWINPKALGTYLLSYISSEYIERLAQRP